ncbi:hypothetical protein LF1_21810 [Rubripirellula obstinata]|uniref:Uncharacterized protein n=1 Tax=Rubripirellula obstinata TaxID=406547 RepID=A0A5B1CGF6_9BACT|nr:hypothetical protein [Rubripirellula obstinata]KAA1259646.1 hypothetical protein LF1_21810 [Rubripirellula obstinata]
MAFSFLRSRSRWIKSRRIQKQNRRTAIEAWAPSVRRLEPRLVLNASAELNPLGQLVLLGTEFGDSLRIEFDSDQALQIFDDTDPGNPNQVVPISGHPDGIAGELNPLSADAITSGQVFVALGSGNDSISTPLLGNLEVFVSGDGGNDTTTLQLNESVVPASGSLFAESEQITLSSSGNSLSLGQADVQLVGAVRFDAALTSPQLQIDNQLVIDGPTTLSSDTTLVGAGRIDLSDSTLSTDASDVDLRIAMGGGNVLLGEVDGSGGQLLNTLTVQSASETIFAGSQVLLESELIVEDVSAIHIESMIFASDVSLSGGNVTVINDITSASGDIQVEASQGFILGGQAEIFSGNDRILISGNNSDFDASAGTLRSNSSSDAIVISGFDQVNLGDTFATDGQLVLGTTGNELNSVFQEPGTTIEADRLAGVVTSEVRLANNANQFRVITDLVAGDGIDLVDSADDLLVESLISNSGDVDVMAAGALAIGNVQAAGNSINLHADRIDDAENDDAENDNNKDTDLSAANVTLTATNGIGDQQVLELDGTDKLIANSDAGDVNLVFLGDQSVGIQQVTTSDSNISLRTTGVASDLSIDEITVGGEGLVTLISSDDILGPDDNSLVSATQLSVTAANLSGDQDASIRLRTDVNDLAASVLGSNRGDLIIDHVDTIDPLRLGGLANQAGQSITPIQTGNGQIIIRSDSEIEVVDLTTGDAGPDQQADPEIDALGEFGRVDLEAPTIRLQDDVQIHGEKLFQDLDQASQPRPLGDLTQPGGNRTERTIFLATNEFYVGENVELFTGEGQGTARQFLPRPGGDQATAAIDAAIDAGIDHAFFDPASVRTNVLTQALQNDATGILTVNVGTPGERGLTVTIDWGDSDPRRFQQVDNLHSNQNAFVGVDPARDGQPTVTQYSPTGDGTARFTHLYLEGDTLDSRSNGRTAATEPYNVRFSVRHHDSIVVQSLVEGETAGVFQTGSSITPEAELVPVAGGLLSSTDNPTTNLDSGMGPQLETGTATFIIPNLTIPVAFFPVRDVIPEFEPVNQIVSTDQTVEVLTSTLEVAEVPTTSIVSREEYFQLRVLSPDPDGEDLVAPEKLPADIFDGDQLRKLFSQLPDGAYEIEKVVGDGNERSILRVEVRQGEATIPDDELDEGVLRLRPLDLPTNPDEQLDDGNDDQESDQETDLDLAYLPGAAVMAVTGTVVAKRQRRSAVVSENAGQIESAVWQRHRRSTKNRSRLSRSSRFGKRRNG